MKEDNSLKVGNKVWLRTDLTDGEIYSNNTWVREMKKGIEVTIVSTTVNDWFQIDDEEGYLYTYKMIDWDKTNNIDPLDYGLGGFDNNYTFEKLSEVNTMSDFKLIINKTHDLAIVPSKRIEDGGYDFYTTERDIIMLQPGESHLFPTGIRTVFNKKFVALLRERGSTGMKCISQRAGVIDSGFRAEWKVPLNNTGNKTVVFYDEQNEHHLLYIDDSKTLERITNADIYIFYPYSKAITQAVFVEAEHFNETVEVDDSEYEKYTSDRGDGMAGSSGK